MFKFVLRGIWYYRRINLVVMLAVAVSTAVIAGSLIVGDSIRHSLRQMTEQRLGQITHVMHSPRFIRQNLVREMQSTARVGSVAPALLMTGSIEAKTDSGGLRRAGSVTLLAVEESGWQLLENGGLKPPQDRDVLLGFRTAQELQVTTGDEISVWVEIPSSIPRDSLLGERDEVNVELVVTVSDVIPEDVGASRFDLNPGQQLPYNAFISLATLQARLGLEQVEASRRSPIAKDARVNTILVGSDNPTDRNPTSQAEIAAGMATLNDLMRKKLTLEDVGLKLRPITERGYVSAESDRMILEDSLADAVKTAAENLGLETAPTLVYLANEIYASNRSNPDERFAMYSIVAGLQYDSDAPLGPFRVSGTTTVPSPSPDGILVSEWLASQLQVTRGDNVTLTWHEVGSHGELPEITKSFEVQGVFPDNDPVTVDSHLTPVVEGITDVETFGDWDQPFDMDISRITERGHDYWEALRATPKAFVALETAANLWSSRYGKYTSIRIASSAPGTTLTEQQLTNVLNRLEFGVLQQLQPDRMGLVFRPIRAEGLRASVGANDFTGLFIGFSFFLILSAIILASLMFRLGTQKRINQLGLLSAVGWPGAQSRRLFVYEGLWVCIAGAVLGAVVGVYFAKIMIHGLTTWWIGAVGTKFLMLDVQPVKLIIAATATVTLALVVILMALRSFRHIAIREQLAGKSEAADFATGDGWWGRCVQFVGIGSLLAAIALPIAVLTDAIPSGVAFEGITWPMVCFFAGGFACLTAGLYLLRQALNRRSRSETINSTAGGVGGLALANAARSPMRSLLTTALIAFATFVIVAVGAGRRNPLSEVPDITSGNGGFSLVAESAQPILFDLNTTDGRRQLGFEDGDLQLPNSCRLYSFSLKPGADASCVNLYQATVPTLLGASDDFINRGGFRFANSKAENPWRQLNESWDDTPVPNSSDSIPTIPVIGDANTLQYSLKKRVGATIFVPSETAPEFALRVVGMLDGSIFQGVLVMNDANLKRVDADVAGARYFLIETETVGQIDQTATALESTLNDYGMDAERVSERLAGFLAVQNTYLSTFQMLGGLGLLVGTFGLAAVMMRNVVERRREIALLRAVGFTTLRISRLILYENNVLLLWGILLGATSALLAMSPHLQSTGGDLPWKSLAVTLAAVAVVGSLASLFAVRAASMVSIKDNLASE